MYIFQPFYYFPPHKLLKKSQMDHFLRLDGVPPTMSDIDVYDFFHCKIGSVEFVKLWEMESFVTDGNGKRHCFKLMQSSGAIMFKEMESANKCLAESPHLTPVKGMDGVEENLAIVASSLNENVVNINKRNAKCFTR